MSASIGTGDPVLGVLVDIAGDLVAGRWTCWTDVEKEGVLYRRGRGSDLRPAAGRWAASIELAIQAAGTRRRIGAHVAHQQLSPVPGSTSRNRALPRLERQM
ncbi:MAG: hypothetical protein M3066_09055 [Actinomycetota bacterium]|nr:hypothetical protein [Actinomycetota bacterium]